MGLGILLRKRFISCLFSVGFNGAVALNENDLVAGLGWTRGAEGTVPVDILSKTLEIWPRVGDELLEYLFSSFVLPSTLRFQRESL